MDYQGTFDAWSTLAQGLPKRILVDQSLVDFVQSPRVLLRPKGEGNSVSHISVTYRRQLARFIALVVVRYTKHSFLPWFLVRVVFLFSLFPSFSCFFLFVHGFLFYLHFLSLSFWFLF